MFIFLKCIGKRINLDSLYYFYLINVQFLARIAVFFFFFFFFFFFVFFVFVLFFFNCESSIPYHVFLRCVINMFMHRNLFFQATPP